MRIAHLLVCVLLLIGLLLLESRVWQVGLTGLLANFRVVGWWKVLWILLEIVPILLHTAG
jgi:hypothetical protein